MAKVMSVDDQLAMWKKLTDIQETFDYSERGFLMFANYCLNNLIKGSPDLTYSQADICKYLFHNGYSLKKYKKKIKKKHLKKSKKGAKVKYKFRLKPTGIGQRLRMVQANRGLGKTTLCAIYAVFRILHDPTTRVLIFSAGGKLSQEIANWIIQIIEGLDILHFILPDRQNGDRASMESYDIHWVFRGAEKSPSVKCLGIDSNAAGSRADLLIADDIESMKNSRTVMMKELLIELTKEFESICQTGDIVYLGTPQFTGSIYNGLPSRGFDVRIWPGRYPTVDQMDAYGHHLAPSFVNHIKNDPSIQTGYGFDGKQGKPTTPEMFSDKLLVEKEISQGKAKFQLQYMLNTRLADADRYPLKLSSLVIQPFNNERGVVTPIWCNDPRNQLHYDLLSNLQSDKLYSPMAGQYEHRAFERSLMYVDPAGGGKNGDETAYAVIRLIGSFVYVQALGGVPGGYGENAMKGLVEIAKRYNIKEVFYEKNYGNGAWEAVARPYFQVDWPVDLQEHWATGQKELRIIDTLEPLISSHRLVVHPDVIRDDLSSINRYGDEIKKTYSGLFQMSMITRDKNCLVHDDRLDALAGAVHQITEQVGFDNETEMEKRRAVEYQNWIETMRNPQNYREDVSIYEATGKTLGSQFKSRKW